MQDGNKKQKLLIKKHEKITHMKSDILHSDMATQKKNLELRLLRRRVQKRADSRKMNHNFPKIGIEEGTENELSLIMGKTNSITKDESWNDDDSSLLNEFQSSKDKTNFTYDYFGEDMKFNE